MPPTPDHELNTFARKGRTTMLDSTNRRRCAAAFVAVLLTASFAALASAVADDVADEVRTVEPRRRLATGRLAVRAAPEPVGVLSPTRRRSGRARSRSARMRRRAARPTGRGGSRPVQMRGAREVSSAGVAALRRAAERPSNEAD